MSSESAVHMPGAPEGATVIETGGAPKAPVAVPPAAPVAGMSESQARAMAWVNETAKPAILRGADSNAFLSKKYNEALEHIYYGGPEPAWLAADNEGPAVPDMRPYDPLEKEFADAAKPATEHQRSAAVSLAVLRGVDRGLAEGVSALCAELELSEGHTAAVLDRVRAHAGKDHWHEAADDIDVLADHEIGEYVREASRILGSPEKLQALREQAYAFVKSRGLTEKYEKMDFWRSTLSFDPKLLHTLAMAGARRGS